MAVTGKPGRGFVPGSYTGLGHEHVRRASSRPRPPSIVERRRTDKRRAIEPYSYKEYCRTSSTADVPVDESPTSTVMLL